MAATFRELDDAESWLTEWELYEENLKKIDENEYKKLLAATDNYCTAQQSLKKCVDMQKKNLKAFTDSFHRIKNSSSNVSEEILMKMCDKMHQIYPMFNDFEEALPKTAGWFLRACIGEIDITLYNNKRHYKDIYEKFKLKTMMLAMIISLINLTLVENKFADALFNALLVWYYSSLTLQEQILRANGSRIKGWYVAHHYFSILLSGFLLIWPASDSYEKFRTQFYLFVLYLSFVQCLQYHYQSGVMYKMRALGHGKPMDVTEDGIRLWALQRLSFLVPFLIGGHLFEWYNAYKLYLISMTAECGEWQVLASAVLFSVLGTGNMITLAIVLRQKFSRRVLLTFPC